MTCCQVQGNIKSKDIVQSLLRCLEGGEAVPGTTVKARPALPVQTLTPADTDGSTGSGASLADKHTAFSAALAEAAPEIDSSLPQSRAAVSSSSDADFADAPDGSLPAAAEAPCTSADLPQHEVSELQASTELVSPAAEADVGSRQLRSPTAAAKQLIALPDAITAEHSCGPDCIGNPLYEEQTRAVPMPTAQPAFQSALPPADSQPHSSGQMAEGNAESSVPGHEHPAEGLRVPFSRPCVQQCKLEATCRVQNSVKPCFEPTQKQGCLSGCLHASQHATTCFGYILYSRS